MQTRSYRRAAWFILFGILAHRMAMAYPLVISQVKTAKDCTYYGGTWDARSRMCTMTQAGCEAVSGDWENGQCTIYVATTDH